MVFALPAEEDCAAFVQRARRQYIACQRLTRTTRELLFISQIAGEQFYLLEVFFHRLLLDYITTPPPAWMLAPVSQPPSSLTTKPTTSAMSLGVPTRLRGEASIAMLRNASGIMSVSVYPGDT